MRRYAALVTVLLFVVAGAVPAIADTTGTLVITTDTTLTEDHDGPISIVADGVTLDCDGHAVSGYDSEEGVGILLRGVSGATVKNCTVFGDVVGILIDDSHNNTVKNNVATGGLDSAFRIDGGTGNTLKGNHAEFSGSHGFELAFASHNTLLRNTSENNHFVSPNGAGFAINDYSHSNVLRDNEATSNFSGLLLSTYVIENDVIGNDFSDNVAGVLINEFATDNTLINNQMTNNTWIGLVAFNSSSGNLLVGNTLCDNGESADFNLHYDEDSEPIVKKNNEICDI
jgi:parallel beta-helix repeat protein